MGNQFGYKKYMKKEAQKDNSLLKIFVLSFFGMLIVFTFLIKSFSPTVDTSIGDYQDDSANQQEETAKNVDDRLSMIQSEDQGRSFSDLMSKPDDVPQKADNQTDVVVDQSKTVKENNVNLPCHGMLYRTGLRLECPRGEMGQQEFDNQRTTSGARNGRSAFLAHSCRGMEGRGEEDETWRSDHHRHLRILEPH